MRLIHTFSRFGMCVTRASIVRNLFIAKIYPQKDVFHVSNYD